MENHWRQLVGHLALAFVLVPFICNAQVLEKGITPELLSKATSGDPDSQTKVGISYEFGEGVPKDYDQALIWFHKAADQGFARAEYHLGLMCSRGDGVSQDYSLAVDWYEKAAAQNDVEAIVDLGLFYTNGREVPKDTKKAFALFYRAAQLGESDAQYRVALAYADGQDVPQDLKLAAEWYRKSADQGFAGAQFNYAMMCIQSKDYEGGYFWLSLAADTLKGEPLKKTVEIRDLCAAQLDSSKLKNVSQRINKWRVDHPGKHY